MTVNIFYRNSSSYIIEGACSWAQTCAKRIYFAEEGIACRACGIRSAFHQRRMKHVQIESFHELTHTHSLCIDDDEDRFYLASAQFDVTHASTGRETRSVLIDQKQTNQSNQTIACKDFFLHFFLSVHDVHCVAVIPCRGTFCGGA